MNEGMNEQAIAAGRVQRVRSALRGAAVDDIDAGRLQELRDGLRFPTSLEYALIAEATGYTVDWLLHGRDLGDAASIVICTAVRYGGRDLCGCEDCVEYTAEQADEYGC